MIELKLEQDLMSCILCERELSETWFPSSIEIISPRKDHVIPQEL